MTSRMLLPGFLLATTVLAWGGPAGVAQARCRERHIRPAQAGDGPFSAATNFAADLLGLPDTRPGTWGRAEALDVPIRFYPPAGRRVRILRVYGDLVAWFREDPPAGRRAGVLFGLLRSGQTGSANGWPLSEECFLYIQDGVGRSSRRAPFDHQTHIGGLLGPDHVMLARVAVWLNDTELPLHIEPTFVVIFRFEKEVE